jgi:hypothetical protein
MEISTKKIQTNGDKYKKYKQMEKNTKDTQ